MMRNIYKLLIGSLFLMVGCGDDDSSPVLLSSENGKFIDERDGSVYHWVRYGDLEWMVENIRLKTDKGKCQIYSENLITAEERKEQEEYNYSKYGYLYDYESAESVVPRGWRIPSDKDWLYLEEMMGMGKEDLLKFGWRGDQEGAILQQQESIWLRPGGFINYEADRLGIELNSYTPDFVGFYGFFWTSTKDTDKENAVIYRQIRYNSSKLGRFSTLPRKLLSLRCVRDAAR